MLTIPLLPQPSQFVNVNLAGQPCTIDVYQKNTGLFLDLLVNGSLIIGGVICNNKDRIVRNSYLGFLGDLIWIDVQGTTDPVYAGIGTRFFLEYLTEADLAGADR